MEELRYKKLLDGFLSKEYTVDEFIDIFMSEWKKDRDSCVKHDAKFQDLIDRTFTTCDCYYEKPENEFEISEVQLLQEVSSLYHSWSAA